MNYKLKLIVLIASFFIFGCTLVPVYGEKTVNDLLADTEGLVEVTEKSVTRIITTGVVTPKEYCEQMLKQSAFIAHKGKEDMPVCDVNKASEKDTLALSLLFDVASITTIIKFIKIIEEDEEEVVTRKQYNRVGIIKNRFKKLKLEEKVEYLVKKYQHRM
jgi:hypothetical protein